MSSKQTPGNNCVLVASELTDTAAPVSNSKDNFCLFISNVTNMGQDELLSTLNNGVVVSSGVGSHTYIVSLMRLSHIMGIVRH